MIEACTKSISIAALSQVSSIQLSGNAVLLQFCKRICRGSISMQVEHGFIESNGIRNSPMGEI
jgi:hypothetical protein